MTVWRVGTSGFAFKEWKGPFYPVKLKDAEMLSAYASRLPMVELNNTFYRMPQEKSLLAWAAQVPEEFRFAVKANQRITHYAQLRDTGETVAFLARTVAVLGPRLGPTLFQLPPHLKRDLDRLERFLTELPKHWAVTVEFRHQSWFDDDRASELLRDHGVALCLSDQPDWQTPQIATTTWGYARLHRFDYTEDELSDWSRRLSGFGWSEAYVVFKHDHTPGSGPLVAEAMIARLAKLA